MILSQLNQCLEQRKRGTLLDLARHIGAEPDALRGMLAMLERKGRVRKLPAALCGGGCSKCPPASIEIYEWVAD